jgi:glycosyltransferase involved in cell wall biosynthesis
MEHCIDSLLPGGEQIEIIIIDDGSKDNTAKIADKYQKKYPKIVKVRHQENGVHGEGINQGIKMAEGRYIKVIDSDDWADTKAYKTLLKRIPKIDTDVVIMNYVYTYTDGRKNQTIDYSNVFPDNVDCTWDDIKRFKVQQYLTLHSMMYKKETILKAKMKLPKHTFYEDNLFIYLALKYVNTIHYMNLDFYHYFIGREDQSVQEPQLIKRSSHQVLVTKLACNAYDLDTIKNRKLRKIMYRECVFLMSVGVLFSRLMMSDEGEKQFKDLWASIKKENPKLYKKMRHFTLASLASLPGKFGRAVCVNVYKFAHHLVKFN